jgi:hypothetical protein
VRAATGRSLEMGSSGSTPSSTSLLLICPAGAARTHSYGTLHTVCSGDLPVPGRCKKSTPPPSFLKGDARVVGKFHEGLDGASAAAHSSISLQACCCQPVASVARECEEKESSSHTGTDFITACHCATSDHHLTVLASMPGGNSLVMGFSRRANRKSLQQFADQASKRIARSTREVLLHAT